MPLTVAPDAWRDVTASYRSCSERALKNSEEDRAGPATFASAPLLRRQRSVCGQSGIASTRCRKRAGLRDRSTSCRLTRRATIRGRLASHEDAAGSSRTVLTASKLLLIDWYAGYGDSPIVNPAATRRCQSCNCCGRRARVSGEALPVYGLQQRRFWKLPRLADPE